MCVFLSNMIIFQKSMFLGDPVTLGLNFFQIDFVRCTVSSGSGSCTGSGITSDSGSTF